MSTTTRKPAAKKAGTTTKPRGRAAAKGPAAKVATPANAAAAVQQSRVDSITPNVLEALKGAKVQPADLQPEQLERALDRIATGGGLAKKALAIYVLEGKTTAAQVADGRRARGQAADSRKATSGPRPGSSLHDAIVVLRDADEPMRPQDIYEAGKKRRLMKGLKGKTPVATLAAQMAVQTAKGQLFRRPAPGRYELLDKAA